MAESSTELHENRSDLSDHTVDLHRALVSLQEELEAADWYGQRVDAARDDELRAILAHNRDEEKEHAAMLLEWIRRHDPVVERMLETYLFSDGSIVARESDDDGEAASDRDESSGRDGSLGVGSLREAVNGE